MTPQNILADLWAEGIALRLTDDGASLAAPAGRLSPEQRALVLAHKSELISLLAEAHKTTEVLLTTAMRVSYHYNDSRAAHELMQRDCLATPPHLRADLLAHFAQTYMKPKR